MSNESETLSARQLAIIPHLLSSPSIEAACRRGKISKVAVYNWMKNPAFKLELQTRRKAAYENSLAMLATGTSKAVKKLLQLINSDREDVALRACALVISSAIRGKEMETAAKSPIGDSPFTAENLEAAWKLVKVESNGAVKLIEKNPESAV